MEIKAALVKELRERTGAGMLDCKKALVENGADVEKAIDWLREKGISKAAKKSGRIAAEGLVFSLVSEDHKKGAVLEFNSETDFVAKNDDFKNFGSLLLTHIVEKGIKTVEELKALEIDGKTVEALLTELIATIGENMNIRRLEFLEACDSTFIVDYLHLGGKIGVLVKANGEATEENVEKLRGVAMHVAAMDPSFLSKDEVSDEHLKKEEEILRTQFMEEAEASGKVVKPEMLDRIIAGKIGKFYEENCLNEQKYVRDDKKTVSQFLAPITIINFVRYKVGDGLEKKEEDFAAEVAAQIAGK